jgi:tetratricopeptide (TPR) repeat protein
MKYYFLMALFCMNSFSWSQTGSYYGNPSDAAELCGIRVQASNSFSSNQEAQKALDKIIAVTGISKRFALYQCNGINNCEAITYRGIRYIFYDQNFMKSITTAAGSWTNLSILAHEVGHHVNAHSLDWLALASGEIQGITLAQKRQQEIEADEFSGFVLAKLGATLLQAQAAIKLATDDGDDTYSTHPSKSKRLSAIERGYNQGKGITNKAYSSGSLTAEDYFYLAYNSDNNVEKMSNYSKSIQLSSGNISAYLNRGNVYRDEKRFGEAITDFDKVIELAKNSKSQSFKDLLDDGYRGKGWCYRQMIYSNENDADYYHQKAIIEFTNAVNSDPSALNYLARADIYSERLYQTEENSYERTSMANKALSDYNSAARLDPNDPDIFQRRASLYNNYLNDKKAAMNDYKKVSELKPNDLYSFFFLGLIYHELDNFDLAIQNYTKSISIYPDGMTYYRRAESYIEQEKYKEAISDYTKAISISKDTTNDSWAIVEFNIIDIYWGRAYCYNRLNNYTSAIADYSKIIELTIDEPGAETYLRRAQNYAKLKRNDLAIADFNKAILIDPTFTDSYHSRGYFYQFTLQKNEKALEDYTKVIQLDSEYLAAYYNRGLIFMDNGEFEKAIKDFSKIIDADDGIDGEVYYLRGISNNEMNQFEAAIKDFNSAISLSPNKSDYYNKRGISKYYLNQNIEAIEDFKMAIGIFPKNEIAYFNLGLAHDALSQYNIAIQAYSKSIEIDPKFVRAYVYRGRSRNDSGLFQQAILDFNKALELDPKNVDAYVNRGISKSKLKQYQQAILDLNKAIVLDPEFGFAYSKRGEAKFYLNNKTEACADWEKSIELGYDYAENFIEKNCVLQDQTFFKIPNSSYVYQKNEESIKIDGISKTNEFTILTLTCYPSKKYTEGWTVCFDKSGYIEQNGMKHYLKKSTGIPSCPDRHTFKSVNESLTFYLYFDASINLEEKFNLIEGLPGGFEFYNISK